MKPKPRNYSGSVGWGVWAFCIVLALAFGSIWPHFAVLTYWLGCLVSQRDTYAHVDWMDEVYGR